MTERRNWGRFGADDERGMANLLQGETVLRACRSVKAGTVYDLGIPLRRDAPVVSPRIPPIHFMSIDGGDYAALEREEHGGAEDYVMLCTHGTTHIDALSHYWTDGQMYNGFSYREVRSSGAGKCAIDQTKALVTRAHLLDFTRVALPVPDRIRTADIEAYLKAAQIEVAPGDALLFRTGWMDVALAKGDLTGPFPTVDPEITNWVADNDISILGADNEAVEAIPQGLMPLHEAMLKNLGVYLMELMTLRAPAENGVKTGLLVVAPLLISRGVGSPLNPVLIA
jgi:kynurenine formamidase